MDKEKLEKALKSIGKKSFVEDYEVYSKQKLESAKRIEILSEKYSRNGAAIRVSFADDIFKHGKQREALKLIIESVRISADIKLQASRLLMVK